ncbi:MAG: cytochrome-c peroxidase [Bacteroidota bacterium]
MKLITLSFSVFLFLLFCVSCEEEGLDLEYNTYTKEGYAIMSQYLDLPEEPLTYMDQFPRHVRSPLRGNFVHDSNVATLGRVLFYDQNLSADGTISCASCHHQHLAFADDKAFSDGVSGRTTDRNSLALGAVFSFRAHYSGVRIPLFWDNRAFSLRAQMEETFANRKEMNMSMEDVLNAVQAQPYYEPLFQAAYRESVLNSRQILHAIT